MNETTELTLEEAEQGLETARRVLHGLLDEQSDLSIRIREGYLDVVRASDRVLEARARARERSG